MAVTDRLRRRLAAAVCSETAAVSYTYLPYTGLGAGLLRDPARRVHRGQESAAR